MFVMVAVSCPNLLGIARLPAAYLLQPPGSPAVGILSNLTRSNPFIAHTFYSTPRPGRKSSIIPFFGVCVS